ncbi:hypothetical protein F4825DRAFT_443066 [Nemania diffusa]|nr:hypothetical protein F4825DRAFT_443066 [Nemania diffusa]
MLSFPTDIVYGWVLTLLIVYAWHWPHLSCSYLSTKTNCLRDKVSDKTDKYFRAYLRDMVRWNADWQASLGKGIIETEVVDLVVYLLKLCCLPIRRQEQSFHPHHLLIAKVTIIPQGTFPLRTSCSVCWFWYLGIIRFA